MRWNTSSTRMSVLSSPRAGWNAATLRYISTANPCPRHSSRKTMRLPERMLLSVMLALGALTGATSAHADVIDLKPFKTTFTAEWKGMTAGTTVLELRRAGVDQYSYSSVSNARGIFRMAFSETLTQVSTFRLQDGVVQPLTFRGVDEKDREIRLDFDWANQRVTGVAKNHAVDLALEAGAQDAMSLQIHILRSL